MEDINATQELRACSDSEGLGWCSNDTFVFGYVSEVNGPDSAEIPDFAPTRHELIQLVKYWDTLRLDQLFYFFVVGQVGFCDSRRSAFASRRISRIATLLGEDEVQKAIQEAEEEFSKRTDPRAWAIFKNGTPEEQEAFQDEVLRKFCEGGQDTPR